MVWRLIPIAVLLISSCGINNPEAVVEDSGEFKRIDSLVLEFDEIGSVDLLAIGSYYDENGGAVAILRTTLERRYIDIFDTQSGKLLNKIPIEYDGPDGVGGEISKIVISDPKSVYIFNQWTGFFTQHDTNGKILNKFKINFNENSGRGYLSPGSWLYQNYIIHKNTIYFSGWLPWAHQAKSTEQIGLINLKTKEVATRFSRPEQYETYMWGAGNLYELYMDFHSVTNELILSYPIENDLILLNPQNGKIRRVNAASKHFSEVKPFSQDFEKIDIQGLMDHDKNNKFFIGVIFDPSNNFIYRMTSRPTPESDVNQAKPRLISVIILDKDFNKIDEIDLDLVDLNFNMGFISTKGWYILNRKLTNEKEGQLVFDIYSYR